MRRSSCLAVATAIYRGTPCLIIDMNYFVHILTYGH